MLNTTVGNNILNAFFGKATSTDIIPTGRSCYLGFSTTAPTVGASGDITAFTEPASSTGYKRLKAEMDNASNCVITNGSVNLTWDAPNEGQQFGQATHIGLFANEGTELPIMAFELASVVTLGLKATLILYKGKLKVTLTTSETTA